MNTLTEVKAFQKRERAKRKAGRARPKCIYIFVEGGMVSAVTKAPEADAFPGPCIVVDYDAFNNGSSMARSEAAYERSLMGRTCPQLDKVGVRIY